MCTVGVGFPKLERRVHKILFRDAVGFFKEFLSWTTVENVMKLDMNFAN
jgi:hypothetical protein